MTIGRSGVIDVSQQIEDNCDPPRTQNYCMNEESILGRPVFVAHVAERFAPEHNADKSSGTSGSKCDRLLRASLRSATHLISLGESELL